MFSIHDDRWTSAVSLSGAMLWVVLATLAGTQHAPLGVIELLFLFAPLVVVPLGLRLIGAVSEPGLPFVENAARMIQPLAALSVVAAFWRGPGKTAGLLALPWAIVCGAVALSGLAALRLPVSVPRLVSSIARMDLGLAAGWLLLSRFGIHTGFQEPIVLLTAVHFHYSGFATATIAVAALGFADRWGDAGRVWRPVALGVAFLPFAVAAGFVFSPILRAGAAAAFSVSIVGLAFMLLFQSAMFQSRTACVFVRLASAFVMTGMTLATIYAIGEAAHRDWLTIPRMASTHGWINALGFVTPALLGCLAELRSQREELSDSSIWPSRDRRGHRAEITRLRFIARDYYDL